VTSPDPCSNKSALTSPERCVRDGQPTMYACRIAEENRRSWSVVAQESDELASTSEAFCRSDAWRADCDARRTWARMFCEG
jgi:hypothetical protein